MPFELLHHACNVDGAKKLLLHYDTYTYKKLKT